MKLTGPALGAAAGAALLLACLTGALHSPFLLLVPAPLFLASIRLSPRRGYAVLALALLLLIPAEGLMGLLRCWDALALAGGIALLIGLGGLVRLWLREGTVADRLALRLPATDRRHAGGGEAAAVEGLLHEVRAWSAATAAVAWEVAGGRARPIAASGRTLPPGLNVDGDPLGWLAREGTPLRMERSPAWAGTDAQVIATRVLEQDDVAWLVTYEFPAGARVPSHEELVLHAAPIRSLLAALALQRDATAIQQRLDGLLALLRRIPTEIELAAYGRELLQATLALTGGTGGCVGTWNGESGQVFARTGSDGGPMPGSVFSPPHSELALAVRAGAPILRAPGRWKPGETQVANLDDEWLARPRALALFPLLTPSGPVGALALWSSRSTGFDARSLELIAAVLPYAALHLDHALEYGRLRERADRDMLTGLRNRRAFEAAFLTERLRFERYGHPLAALLIDIDHFKNVNDTFGHEAGDEVLRTVARVLESAVRDVDITARHGGEEFVVLLPETPLAAAAEVAERIRAAVERTAFTATGQPLQVRVSIGVAACPEQAPTPQALLGSADAALYEAKRAGRNQVRVAQPAPRL